MYILWSTWRATLSLVKSNKKFKFKCFKVLKFYQPHIAAPPCTRRTLPQPGRPGQAPPLPWKEKHFGNVEHFDKFWFSFVSSFCSSYCPLTSSCQESVQTPGPSRRRPYSRKREKIRIFWRKKLKEAELWSQNLESWRRKWQLGNLEEGWIMRNKGKLNVSCS